MKTHSKNNLTTLISHFFMICLIFSVLTKPVSILLNQLSDTEQEFYDSSNKNEQSEKKIDIDFENEKTVLTVDEFNTSLLNLNKTQKFSTLHENILDFNLSIHLPPPRLNY